MTPTLRGDKSPLTAPSGLWQYKRPSRARRWLDALRDLPYALTDRIGDDEDPAFLRRLMIAIILTFGLAVASWLTAWVTR